MMSLKPNLFIVGAARSGTTALWHYFKSHPGVFMPGGLWEKEPAFFSQLKKSRFNKLHQYLKIFEQANDNHKWIGEASTAYLTDPDSARQIFEYNPGAKIIIILRNPALRAYSLYNWMVQKGYEYVETFEKALFLENYRVQIKIPNYYEPEYYYNYLYFNSGLFFQQVKRYKELFEKNVLIIKFEDFVENRNHGLETICQFLQIEPKFIGSGYINNSVRVQSTITQFLLRKLTGSWLSIREKSENIPVEEKKKLLVEKGFADLFALKNVTCIGATQELKIKKLIIKMTERLSEGSLQVNEESIDNRDRLLKIGYINNKKPKKIKKETYLSLIQKYRADVLKLSQYVGIDFSDWLIKER